MEENKTLETAVEQPQFKTVKKVRIKDFDMENVEIVPYNEDIIGDNDEVTYENYINLHGQVYPDILDSMKDGTHKMDEAESYIADYVKDKFKDKNRSSAAVSSNTVFALLVNYYMSPVVEEQIKIEPKPTYIPSAYTPLTPEQIEANRKKREQEEAERKEKARLEALRKKQEEVDKHFAGSLFGF